MVRRNVVSALALLLAVASVGLAAGEGKDQVVQGTVVEAGDGTLTVQEKDETEATELTVGEDVDIMLDGKDAELADLAAGTKVRVIKDKDGAVRKIVANSKGKS
jgi:hypothetical protein